MRSVDTLVTSNSLLDKMSTHLNGLLRNQEPEVNRAVKVFDGMFANASNALETEADKQVLSILRRQVSSFIGITLGVKPFLDQHNQEALNDDDDDDNKLSWASANEKETSGAWNEKKQYHQENNSDIYAPERLEHERLRQQLEEEQYGQGAHHGESDEHDDDEEEDSESEYEEVVEQVAVKSREIGGAGGFEVVRRKKKKTKKTTITTNFTYSHNSNNDYDNNRPSNNNYNRPPPRHRVRVCEFRPHMLERLCPEQTYCMPLFFPSEDSYSVRPQFNPKKKKKCGKQE